MILLKDVVEIIKLIVMKHEPRLRNKYDHVEYDTTEEGFFLKCSRGQCTERRGYLPTCTCGKGCTLIRLRVAPDVKRRILKVPQSLREYVEGGSSKGLQEKFRNHHPDAWGIEVKCVKGESIFEIAFMGNENNWDEESFRKEFYSIF